MAVILIVEDDDQVRVLAESVLEGDGHSVLAATGAEGAQAVLDQENAIDILFVEISLAGDAEAGLKLAQHVRETHPKLGFLYTTGQGVNAGMRALFSEPFLFLPKPYTVEQLTAAVNVLLNKDRRS